AATCTRDKALIPSLGGGKATSSSGNWSFTRLRRGAGGAGRAPGGLPASWLNCYAYMPILVLEGIDDAA
ncbi:hypothetical protein, partial [Streptomyces rimosus]